MADEFICDTSEVRSFIGAVKEIVSGTASVEARLVAIRPHFSRMMADPDWLPAEFRRTPGSGGDGQRDRKLASVPGYGGDSFPVRPGVAPWCGHTVHDHLAWGLVGLYVGEQDEEIYEAATPVGPNDRHTDLTLVAKKHLGVGSFYELIPPTGDIHRVVTTSDEPSISLHLLGNDVGCVWRHRFEPETGEVAPFRSGYSNKECENDNRNHDS